MVIWRRFCRWVSWRLFLIAGAIMDHVLGREFSHIWWIGDRREGDPKVLRW